MVRMICIRCLNTYQPTSVKRIKTKRLKVKEPACPRCKCKIYCNRNDDEVLTIDFKQEQFTAMEDE